MMNLSPFRTEERRIWKPFRVVAEVEVDALHEGLAIIMAKDRFRTGDYKILEIVCVEPGDVRDEF
jgi:hypothetical protein